MEKDFDKWNGQKKVVNEYELDWDFFYHQREVWWCPIGLNVDVETDGKQINFERPVLVIQKFNKEMFWGASVIDLPAPGADGQAGNFSQNLGIYANVDGGATPVPSSDGGATGQATTPEQIIVDTSVPATYTILYSATDQAGNTGTATRTVIVEAPANLVVADATSQPEAGPPPAETPPTSDATATTTTP